MIDNYMFDIEHKEYFLLGENDPEQYHSYWWDDGEPLWVTASKQVYKAYSSKDQLSLTNPRDALHHGERAANK